MKQFKIVLVSALVSMLGAVALWQTALAKPGDLLVVHTTSGNSTNLVRAAEAAARKGVAVLAMSARDGGKIKSVATHTVIIPTERTDRAQELQLCIQHIICDLVERDL